MKPIPTFKVCVRCITFNHAPYIEDAMNGFAMQQTTFPYVCVIIDDASVDGEPEVIKTYLQNNFCLDDESETRRQETDDYVHIFARHRENLNCYFAVYLLKYNHYRIKKDKYSYPAQYQTPAKYIALCEGDDYWIASEKLQKQVEFLEKHKDYSMVYTGFQTVDQDGKDIVRENYDAMMQRSRSGDILPMLLESNFILTCTTAFRCEVFEQSWYRGLSFAYDYTLFLTASICGKCSYLPEKTSAYRQTPTGAMATQQHIFKPRFHKTRIWAYDGLCSGRIPIEATRLTPQMKKYITTICFLQDNIEFRNKYVSIVRQNRILWKYAPMAFFKKLFVLFST